MEEFNNESQLMIRQSQEVAVSHVQAAVTAEIQSALAIAKKFPRDEDEARFKILRTCKRPKFAPCVEYSKPIGGTRVKNISIRGAEVASNAWGNIKTMASILFDDNGSEDTPGRRIISITAMDLETNTSYNSQLVIEKTVERSSVKPGQKVYGSRLNSYGKKTYIVRPTSDEFEVKVASATSKLLRNNILRLIPEDIKDEMIEVAQKTILDGAAEDPDGARKRILDGFAILNITPSDLKEYLGKDPSKLSPAEIVELGTVWKTIKDGQARWDDYIEESREKRMKKNKDEKQPENNGFKEKVAAKAKEEPPRTEPEKETIPEEQETIAENTEQSPDYTDIDDVKTSFRSAADKETLISMQSMISEVSPDFRDEARSEFDRCLIVHDEPREEEKKVDPDLAKRLQWVCVGLDEDEKAIISKELFNDGRKKKFRVRDLDQEHLERLESILIDKNIIQGDK